MVNLGIVVADFHKEIAEEMLDEAKKTCEEKGFNVSLTVVGEGMLYAENKNGI